MQRHCKRERLASATLENPQMARGEIVVPSFHFKFKARQGDHKGSNPVAEGSRLLLGTHVKPKDSSATVYSRDALPRPLRELGAVPGQVLRGEFTPDRSRSGYVSQQVQEGAQQQPEVEE
eukprot:28898-Amphidinium_carterae.1